MYHHGAFVFGPIIFVTHAAVAGGIFCLLFWMGKSLKRIADALEKNNSSEKKESV